MATIRELKLIETKLQKGVKTFTAHEVASLLNHIKLLNNLKGRKK